MYRITYVLDSACYRDTADSMSEMMAMIANLHDAGAISVNVQPIPAIEENDNAD